MSARPSRSRSRSPRQRLFKIRLILPRSCELPPEETMKLVDTWGVQRIKVSDLTEEANSDQVLTIIGKTQSVVFNAFTECLGKFIFAHSDSGESKILISEGMAGRLTRRKLDEVQDLSQASIALQGNVPDRGVPLRVSGRLSAVESAFEVILNALSEEGETEKADSPTAKFVVLKSVLPQLQSDFLPHCREECKIDITFSESDGPPCLDSEAIVTLKGKATNFKPAIQMLITQLSDLAPSDSDDPLKMLVPSNQVRKLIGQGGTMIKEIQNRTGGANIKVVSEKNNERQLNTIVTISGSKESKGEACRIIIEKLEAFKSGTAMEPQRENRFQGRESPRSQRLSINITVPDAHVCRLIGRKGETINSLKRKSGCHFEFEKQPCTEVLTTTNEPSRVCKLSGSLDEVQEGLKLMLELVIALETQK